LKSILFPFLFLFISSNLLSQQSGKTYPDGHGGTVFLPQGDISFADEVVDFKRGNPDAIEEACDSILSLGKPDFAGIAGHFTTLGCGGELTLRFADNALINIKGPDLFVFEVGKYVEATKLQISRDGKKWITVGEIKGGVTSVDLGDSIGQGEVFHYVKLTDLKSDCTGNWPGADIDAVAAIGSGKQITLNSSLLYNLNEYILLSKAKQELDKIIIEIKDKKPSQVIIEGHTDNIGKENYNQQLSDKRAKAVKDYITEKIQPLKIPVKSIGYGSTLPVYSNSTKQGQDQNRRVNIILIP
jgi:OOP family OmpA-OmpF porin